METVERRLCACENLFLQTHINDSSSPFPAQPPVSATADDTVFADKLAAPDPAFGAGQQLRESPGVYLTEGVLSSETVMHVVSKIEATPSTSWEPCIGQTTEFASKRCVVLRVAGDAVLEEAVFAIGQRYDVDVTTLQDEGLPIIRYLPGAPAVGVHGDMGEHGMVPNVTLVLYLTDGGPAVGGRTFFPSDPELKIAPRRGSCLSFANGGPAARHGVERLSPDAPSDRLVVQIPLLQRSAGERGVAYAEHVSGTKIWEIKKGCCRERVPGAPKRTLYLHHHDSLLDKTDILGVNMTEATATCKQDCDDEETCTAVEVHASKKTKKLKRNKNKIQKKTSKGFTCELHTANINSASRKSKACKKAKCFTLDKTGQFGSE